MWSLTTKTRKLKNAASSNPNVTVNYVKSVQMIEFSELLKLSKIQVNGQYEEMIDWRKFDFGSLPEPLSIAYNSDEIIFWLDNEVFMFNWDENVVAADNKHEIMVTTLRENCR